MKKPKICRRRSRSPKYAERSNFTLLCSRNGKEMVSTVFTKIYNAHIQPLFNSLNFLFGAVIFAVAWFA